MTEFAPDAHLFAACMNWGAIYTKLVSTIVNGEFHGGLIYGDVADGTLYLTPFSKNVADGTQEAVQAAMDKRSAANGMCSSRMCTMWTATWCLPLPLPMITFTPA